MQVFKCFLQIVRRNMTQILIYLLVVVFVTIGFSNIGGEQQQKMFSDSRVSLTVIDSDNSALSAALEEVIYEHHNAVEVENDTQALQDALYNRDIEYALFIPQGYEDAFLAGVAPRLESAQIPNSYSGVYVDRLVNRYISTVDVYVQAGEALPDALGDAAADMANEAEVRMTEGVSFDMSPIYYYYSYLSYGLMMMMIFGLGPVLMVFGRKEIAMRMSGSALPLAKKNLGLGLGAAVLAAISLGTLVIFGFVMYGSEMLTAASGICMLNAACYLALSTALAFMIGQIATSANMMSAMANAIVLTLSFLGGVFVPMEIMGSGVQAVAQFMPSYWYVSVPKIAIGHTTLTSGMMTEIWQSMGIQMLFAVAFLAAALVISKRKTVTQ